MIAVVTLALGLLAGADQGAPPAAIASFDRAELAGWTELAPEEVVPFHREGMRSQLLFGARSPAGSYAFVTVIDNTLERPAEDAGEVAAYISEDAYAHFQPEGFQKGFVTISAGDLPLRAAVFSFAARKLPYALGAGTSPAIVKAVFLPVVLRGEGGGSQDYHNLILVANFRGAGEDLPSFERMSRKLVLASDQLALVAAEDFNANRPNLAAPGELVDRERIADPAATPQTPEERVDLLTAAVAHLLRGEASADDLRQIESYARADDTTPLARWILEHQRRDRVRFEARVWQRLLQEGTNDLVARLAFLLLAESISLDDAETVQAVTQGAEKVDLSVADAGCDDLEPLVDAILRKGHSPLFQDPGVRRFLTLDPAGSCRTLRALLASRGWVAVDLIQLARAVRGGQWELRPGVADLPQWVWHENRLWTTVAGGPAGRIFGLAPVTHLLSIVESVGTARH